MIVLDTNVMSELARATPSQAVVDWMRDVPSQSVAVTTITVAEVEYGLARLPAGARKVSLSSTIDRLWSRYLPSVLPFDEDAARIYGTLRAHREHRGVPISQSDAQIAAIALSRTAALATRNVKDFVDLGLTVINPWDLT